MRSIPQALMWETTVRGWWSIPLLFIFGNFLPFITYNLFRGMEVPNEPVFEGLRLGFLFYVAFFFGIGAIFAQGHISRLYAAPVTTPFLVLWHMFFGGLMLCVQLLVTIGLLNTLFHAHWPAVPSIAIAIAGWCAFQLPSSVLHRSIMGLVTTSIPLIGLTAWIAIRFYCGIAIWNQMHVIDWIAILLLIAGSYAFTVYGISSDRCGEHWYPRGILIWLSERWESFQDRSTYSYKPFRSGMEAQAWYEWRQKGLGLPIVYLILVGFAGLIWGLSLLFNSDHGTVVLQEYRELVIAFSGALTGAAALAGLFLGLSLVTGTRNKTFSRFAQDTPVYSMGSFLATRPLENSSLSRCLMRTAALSIATTWALWFAAFMVMIVCGWQSQLPIAKLIPEHIGLWFLPLTLLGPWIAMANVATMGFSGRIYYFVVPLIVLPMSYGLGMDGLKMMVLPSAIETLHQGTMIALSSLIVLGTLAAYRAAYGRNMLSKSSLISAGTFVLAVMIAAIATSPIQLELGSYFTMAAFASLIVLPFATSPLAIAWNRHR
jgi:hypothetical protein